MISHRYQSLKNIRTKVKQHIHAVDMHENYSVMTCNTSIPSVANTLNKIHISTIIFNVFNSTYYNNKNDGFELLFKKYI